MISDRPFVIDLESTNGTHVNGDAIPTSRYYELKAGDGAFLRVSRSSVSQHSSIRSVLKFGTSNREYVLLHDEVS